MLRIFWETVCLQLVSRWNLPVCIARSILVNLGPNRRALSGRQSVNKASTTAITGHSPNPSKGIQNVIVYYEVAANAPGSGTPGGTVMVSDGLGSCPGSVAAGSCVLNLTTVDTRTLTAIYAGDSNFDASTSSGVSRTVYSLPKLYLPLMKR